MLQPNCSELVFWLRDMSGEEIARLLKERVNLPDFPILENERWEKDYCPNGAWDIYMDNDERNQAKTIIAEAKVLGKDPMDALYAAKIYDACLAIDDDGHCISYDQHCQHQGFPLLWEIEQKLADLNPSGWHGEDGGSPEDYIRWKHSQGILLKDEEKGYLEDD